MKKYLLTVLSICLLAFAAQAQIDCDCEINPEDEFICAQDADGNVFPVPNECFAACFELTVVDGECEPDFPGEGEGEWPGSDCDCEEPTEDDLVCVSDEDGNIFPFPSACIAECVGLAVVEGECDFPDFPEGEGEWPEDDCDCPEPGEGDEVCVEIGEGLILPCPSACLAECYGYTVVEGECDYDFPEGEGEWPGDNNGGEWLGSDCDCEEPTEDSEVCVSDEDGNVFPFPSACIAECVGLTVVEGECDFDFPDGGEWPDNEGDWEPCDCEDSTEDDLVCVEDEYGNVFPFESACWAECFGLTVVEGECDFDFPDSGEWPEDDCDCPEPTEEDMVCVDDEGCVFPFPSACLAECFGLTVVEGECAHEWPEDGGDWEPCDCEEPTEENEVCVSDEDGNIFPFPSACIAECVGLEVVDCENVNGNVNYNLAEFDHSLATKTTLNNNFNAPTINLKKLGNEFTLSPNPASTSVQITINANQDTDASIVVFDLSGRVVMSQAATLVKGFNQETLTINSLDAGLYQVQITSDTEVLTTKFIKM